jgi:hypothetical protein
MLNITMKAFSIELTVWHMMLSMFSQWLSTVPLNLGTMLPVLLADRKMKSLISLMLKMVEILNSTTKSMELPMEVKVLETPLEEEEATLPIFQLR